METNKEKDSFHNRETGKLCKPTKFSKFPKIVCKTRISVVKWEHIREMYQRKPTALTGIFRGSKSLKMEGEETMKNKFISSVLALSLAAVTAFTVVPAQQAKAQTLDVFTTSCQMFDLAEEGYNEGVKGPISITQGVLTTKKGKTTDVYVVALSGTENVGGQSTFIATDLLSGFNLNNAYIENVVKVVNNNVPKNSNLIITGHSLGGMIAQQAAGNSTLKKNFNIINTVTFGSPLLSAGKREGTVKRLGDSHDVVPYLSHATIDNSVWAILGLNREDGGYGWDFLGAHCESYGRTDVWGAYDPIGYKNGGATLTLDRDTQVFYQSPSWLW